MHECETRAEVYAHFVDRLTLSENQVARVAGGEDAFARGGLHAVVVAAEAARRVVVPDIVRVGRPVGIHRREDRTPVDGLHRLNGLGQFLGSVLDELRIFLPVVVPQIVRDAHHRLVGRLVPLTQREHGLDLDVGQAPGNRPLLDRHVHGRHGSCELVGGAIVAVHAVHGPHLRRRFVGFAERVVDVVEFAHTPVRSRDAHPGDVLPSLIRRDVLDIGGDEHVVVDARSLHEARLLAADLQQHPQPVRRVLFVRERVGANHLLVTDEFLRPVALFTSLPRGAQVVDRRWNRAREAVDGDGPDLAEAVDLGFDEPVGALADVTLDAGDPRVRRRLIGGPLGMHDVVAELATEARRFGRAVGFVAPETEEDENQQAGHGDRRDGVEVRALGEIQGDSDGASEIPPLRIGNAAAMDHSHHEQQEADRDQQREQEIEDAQVRRGVDDRLQNEEEADAKEPHHGQDRPRQHPPVSLTCRRRMLARFAHHLSLQRDPHRRGPRPLRSLLSNITSIALGCHQ